MEARWAASETTDEEKREAILRQGELLDRVADLQRALARSGNPARKTLADELSAIIDPK